MKPPTEHLIFGAGLIGGYLGACLNANHQATGFTVKVVARETMRERFSQPLTVSDYHDHQDTANSIHFVEQGESVNPEYVWLTVKAVDIDQAIRDLSPHIKAHTTIICCQNGLGIEQLVQWAFPDNRVIHAIVVFNVAQMSVHHLHRGSLGNLIIECNTPADTVLVERLNTDLLPTISVHDIQPYSWGKLQLNLVNALNALADMPVKTMLADRAYRRILALCMNELLAVTDAMHLELPKFSPLSAHWLPRMLSMPNFIFLHLGRKMLDVDPTVRTSMWWDLHNHKRTEIDLLNGAVIKQAQQLGIACPVNQRIVELVHQAEQSKTLPAFSPQAFLAER